MEQWNPMLAYAALFGISFLASTLLPLGSEWLLLGLVLLGYSPVLTVAVATLGNTLGACTTYAIGRWGGRERVLRGFHMNPASLARSHRLYVRYGSWSLLFSWLPIVGDPLCAISGFFEQAWPAFLALVFTGKLVRYIAVAWLTLQAA
jgi:membrane protein YqaA with SNARE-associated domain